MNLSPGFSKVFPTAHRLLLGKALCRLDLFSYHTVLNVGAGRDPYRKLFSNAHKYIRIDLKLNDGFTDVVADAIELPFKDASFDFVFASEVLEHLKTPSFYVKELRRVLKQGGATVLSVPFMFHQHSDPHDYWRPTNVALKELFCLFKEVEIIAFGNRIHVMFDLLTTAFSPNVIFYPLRILNHFLVHLPKSINFNKITTTAPSGFLLVAKK